MQMISRTESKSPSESILNNMADRLIKDLDMKYSKYTNDENDNDSRYEFHTDDKMYETSNFLR